MIDKAKVRELAKTLADSQYRELKIEAEITEWLEQNQPSPQVVGLSDEQILDLAGNFFDDAGVSRLIKRWLKTQTFTHPEKFTPSWDDAPIRADEFSIALIWYKDGVPIESKELSSEQRPKTTPEVGQVWVAKKLDDFEVTVIGINSAVLAYQRKNGNFGTHGISDFLAKFEQVQS